MEFRPTDQYLLVDIVSVGEFLADRPLIARLFERCGQNVGLARLARHGKNARRGRLWVLRIIYQMFFVCHGPGFSVLKGNSWLCR